MTTGKTKDLARRTFVGKVMSLLFNMLSRLVITFLACFNFMAEITICSDFDQRSTQISKLYVYDFMNIFTPMVTYFT